MWDTLEPKPWPSYITKTQPCPQISKDPPSPAQGKHCKGAPICPSTAYQGAKTHWIYMIWMWDAFYGALEPKPWSYNLTKNQPCPHFPKIHPYLNRWNKVRVHPYAHPQQHIKVQVLNHFGYTWYGCEMQFAGLWSLNHDLTTSLRLSHAPKFPKIHPNRHRWISLRVHSCAHPQHIKVLKHFGIRHSVHWWL